MAEVREFLLPDLGEGLTEATIVRWMVAPGDVVGIDQSVVEVETAKALVDVPSPYGGVVTARFGAEGDEIPVGTALLTVAVGAPAPDGDGLDGAGAAGAAGEPSPSPSPEASASSKSSESGNVLVGYGTQAATGRRRPVRRPGGPSSGGAGDGAGPEAAATGETAPAQAPAAPAARPHNGTEPGRAPDAPAEGPVAVVSPLVRRLARDHGIDLRSVTGSGPDGLILRADVQQAVRVRKREQEPDRAAPAPQAAPTPAPAGAERVPLRGVRGAIADKLARSRREIPDATTWVDADATALLAARREMNAGAQTPVPLLALLARICTAALARYPELNATVDTEAREVVRLPAVHLGFAAQTDRGLVVPVLRDAHTLSTEQLAEGMARLTAAARAGTLSPAEVTGGTFTLNNYGVFGVDGSTPILNHPEAAMLGVGRIADKPWVVDGQLAVRSVVQLSFTFDHRVCDGGVAGGFLRYVADCVERPAVLLRTL